MADTPRPNHTFRMGDRIIDSKGRHGTVTEPPSTELDFMALGSLFVRFDEPFYTDGDLKLYCCWLPAHQLEHDTSVHYDKQGAPCRNCGRWVRVPWQWPDEHFCSRHCHDRYWKAQPWWIRLGHGLAFHRHPWDVV